MKKRYDIYNWNTWEPFIKTALSKELVFKCDHCSFSQFDELGLVCSKTYTNQDCNTITQSQLLNCDFKVDFETFQKVWSKDKLFFMMFN